MGRSTVTRRRVLGSLATVGVGCLGGCPIGRNLDTGDTIDPFLDGSGADVRIPPGTYEWHGAALEASDRLVGAGDTGDVVLELSSGSMTGSVRGTLGNIVVRGRNPESKAGIDLYPGGKIRGFCWPEGGGRSQDRAIYHPEGGSRTTIRNACVAGLANNGAYVDKAPVTVRNCAFLNNNVANLRVGHRDGSSPVATSRIQDSLVAVTGDVRVGPGDAVQNPVGLRIRHPGRFVVEDCWFIFTADAPSADGLVELRGQDISAEFRNCHFHNGTGNALVRNSGSDNLARLRNCTVSGSGRRTVDETAVLGGLTTATPRVPSPSTVTGFQQADEAFGFDATVPPFGGDGE